MVSTAETILDKHLKSGKITLDRIRKSQIEAMIEFAKLHCIEQIIVISNKAKTKHSPFVDLTAYRLDNIK